MSHWLPHLWLPVLVFILLFVLIKVPTPSRLSAPFKTLHISLQTPQPEKKPIEERPKPKQPTPRQVSKQVDAPKPDQPEPTVPKPDVITKSPITTRPTKPKISLSATDLMQQAKEHTDIQISDEFTARSKKNKMQETPWNTMPTAEEPYADIPYLASYELAVDMEFYSQGYRGDIERFFDKVILQKTFTTKYGTKISCALAVIVVCSWK